MGKEEFYFDSRDNQTKIHAVRWVPEGDKPKAVVQIVHGMAEYVERYEELATFLTERNILVTGEDHLGHGKSIRADKNPGYFCAQDPATVVVRDVHRLKKMTQEKYPGIPYLLLGHSMGSFITRNYLCRYGSGIQGAILVGTGMQPKALLALAKVITGMQRILLGDNHVSGLLNITIFGNSNRKVTSPRTHMDWLTKDEKIVNRYLQDSLCGFTFTVNGFRTLFELTWRVRKKDNLKKIPKELPVHFASGKEDPVGDYGKGVQAAYESLLEVGMENVSIKLYENDRHELLNETDRKEVMQDLYAFIEKVCAKE